MCVVITAGLLFPLLSLNRIVSVSCSPFFPYCLSCLFIRAVSYGNHLLKLQGCNVSLISVAWLSLFTSVGDCQLLSVKGSAIFLDIAMSELMIVSMVGSSNLSCYRLLLFGNSCAEACFFIVLGTSLRINYF